MKEINLRELIPYEIKIRVKSEDGLYNPLDPGRELLSEEVAAYLKRKYKEKPDPLEKPVIKIISEKKVDEKRVRKNIRSYVESELEILAKKRRRSAVKQVRLFVIGIIFLALWIIFEAKSDEVVSTVLCIIGWFAIWEAANIWFVESPEMRFEKRRLQRMEKTEIVFETES